MKFIFSHISMLFVLFLAITACTTKNDSKSQQELAEEIDQFYETAYNNGNIIVIESFHPTIKLTDHQKAVPLDSLVLEYLRLNKTKIDNVGEHFSLVTAGIVISPVSVPKESDLAKAFFLQNFWLFYSQNTKYINSLLYPKKESTPRKDWDKYL